MKAIYSDVLINLDKLLFLPLHENESIDIRAIAIESYLQSVGWSWDDIIFEMAKPESIKE